VDLTGSADEARPTPSPPPPKRPKPPKGPLSRRDASIARWRRSAHVVLNWAQTVPARAPRLIAVLRAVYYPFALLLVAYIGYQVLRKIDLSTVRWGPMVASYFFALIWWISLAMGWSALTTEGYHAGPMRAWCKTQVVRYVPGGFWAPVARATTVHGRVRDRVAAVGAENTILLFISLGVGGAWAAVHRPLWLPLILVAALPMIGIRWLERRSRVTRKAVLMASVTYAVGFVAYGIAGLLAQISVSGLHHPAYPLFVPAASCIAWAVGLVVVFAPGGVGVREVVYIWLLTSLYSSADVRAAAIVSRLVAVAAEFTVLAIISRPQFHRHRVEPADVVDLADDDVATQPS
jgi:glycosyltransferase 2 family protein